MYQNEQNTLIRHGSHDENPLAYDEEEEFYENIYSQRKKNTIIIITAIITTLVILASALGIFFVVYYTTGKQIHDVIDFDGLVKHLKQLEEIARKPSNFGSRAVQTGFNDSAAYVISQLEEHTECKISKQYFKVPIFVEEKEPTLSMVQPSTINYQYMVDFRTLRYSGAGDLQAPLYVHHNKSGCTREEFGPEVNGKIVLMYNINDCPLVERALNAENAGAKAILFRNSKTQKTLSNARVRVVDWNEMSPMVTIPCLSVSYSLGESLSQLSDVELKVQVFAKNTIETTFNVFCDIPASDPTKNITDTLIAGAHLDGVPEGNGINDNGSGASALLEICIQLFSLKKKPVNNVRFAWWGAEEIGLLGSRYYVNRLKEQPEEFKKVSLYLNFDMLGSPNFIRGIFNGNTAVNEKVRKPSMTITNTFISIFNQSEMTYQLSEMVSGSDFQPFAEAGIPSGGLRTGAGVLKTEEERTQFGGFANTPYDPCYHLPCDTVENVNKQVYVELTKAAANAIEIFMMKEKLHDFIQNGE